MLVYLDVLVGLAVIMLGLSLVVTVANQVISSLLGVRGRNLKWGLSVLIQELHSDHFDRPVSVIPVFGADLNKEVAGMVDKLLSHPLVSESKVPVGPWKLASAIRFDELLKIVDLLGASGSQGLDWLRKNNRITEPWFESIMDRVSQRFTMHMRIYSVVFALIIVLWTGMDTLHILTVLRNDATLRSGFVSTADAISKGDGIDINDQAKLRDITKSVISQLPKDQSLRSLLHPDSPGVAGIVLSVVLLSLGAPFWFNALKNLANLRSVTSQRQQRERSEISTRIPDVGDRIAWRDAHV
jgi:hypothetical protein